MGTALSTPLVLDAFADPETQRNRLISLTKGTSPSTSSSSLASTGAHILEATGSVIMGTNAPILYEHALVGDWGALIRRVESHPKEACYKDKCQNMSLHVSCRRQPPPEVVETLIKANPLALTSRTLDGLTPLHFSCFCGSSPESIQLVLGEEINLREMLDRRGRTPLHCVCAGFRSQHRLLVVKMLLRIDATCATAHDERCRTPLSLIVEDYIEELHDALSASQEEALKATQQGGYLYDCWEVVSLLLRAAYGGTLEDNSAAKNEVHVEGRFRILHAAVGMGGCPAILIRLILKISPKAIEERDADSNLPLHVAVKTIGQPWSRKVVTSKKSGVIVYNADFGGKKVLPKDDVTAELVQAYPEAARVQDESGKVPFILAVESGKPWKTSLQPLWEAYQLDDDELLFTLLQEALDAGLTSLSPSVRSESIKSIESIAPKWPESSANDYVLHVIEFARHAGGYEESEGTDEYHSSIYDIQATTLEAMATVFSNCNKSHLTLPQTAQQAVDIALPLLCNNNEAVRTAAARVLGTSASMLGVEATEILLRDVIFPSQLDSTENGDDGSVSTMGGLSTSTLGEMMTDSNEYLHGRAMACSFILGDDQPRILKVEQRSMIKAWLRHESPIVRKGACWAVGSALVLASDIKDFRSTILKCMRPTENPSVQLALSDSLIQASNRHDKLFLCKAGLPLLDGALMLSMARSTLPAVQVAFQLFLWYALQKQESGLQEYLNMAQGENGRIMMSLVTRKLTKLPVVEEGDEGKSNS